MPCALWRGSVGFHAAPRHLAKKPPKKDDKSDDQAEADKAVDKDSQGKEDEVLENEDKSAPEDSQDTLPSSPGQKRGSRRANGGRQKPPPVTPSSVVAKLGDEDSGSNNTVERVTIPEEFPQLVPIPLNKRPLFPGFYKSLYIKDPNVIKVINNLMERRRPYVGVFLTRDDDAEGDVVKDVKEIYKTGVFAQITNTYQTGPDNSTLTVVLYPHRRIRIKSDELIAPPTFFSKDIEPKGQIIDVTNKSDKEENLEHLEKEDDLGLDNAWMSKFEFSRRSRSSF
jgi:Lon-like ATP-dependent protease